VIDVTTLLHTISDQVQENYSEKNIVFAQILPDHATLHSHRGSLEIIIRNLLDNAFKYTPAGGSIIMSLEKDILTIHDSGPGISHDDQQHMREAFWQ
jgi:signal transduction histidine kinase